MHQTERQGTRGPSAKVAVAVLAGLIVLVLLFPASGVDTSPPQCFSAFGYTVPCEALPWPAVAAGAATAAVVGLFLWIAGRREPKN